MATIIRNKKQANFILTKMANENGFDINNVFVNEDFKYIQTVNINEQDADFAKTEYKGFIYKVQYVSGCFYPFIVCLGAKEN